MISSGILHLDPEQLPGRGEAFKQFAGGSSAWPPGYNQGGGTQAYNNSSGILCLDPHRLKNSAK